MGNHPVWSETRDMWVPLAGLRPGEWLRTPDGAAVVLAAEPVPGGQPVWNLEVHGHHTYHAGTAGVLVHNNGACADTVAQINQRSRRQRAPEYFGGVVESSRFLDLAREYLGPGYRSLVDGRYVSADGLRQVRFGPHEVRATLHAHFEASNVSQWIGG